MNVHDDAILDATLRDFLRDRASDTAGIRDASTMASAIALRVPTSGRPAVAIPSRRLVWIAAATLLAVVAIAAAIGSRPSPSPPGVSNGWIAYSTDPSHPGSTDRSTGSDIYLVREGGTPILIAARADGRTRNACPAFSPDGTRLAWGKASPGRNEIVVFGVDDAGLTDEVSRIDVPGGWPVCVRWSSDGERLAYFDMGAVVRGLDGSTLESAPGDPVWPDPARPSEDSAGALSPSLEWSARVTSDGEDCQLVIGRPDPGRETVEGRAGAAPEADPDAHVIPLSECGHIVAWSPDGTRILMIKDVNGFDFTMHSVAIDRDLQTVVVAMVRTNGSRSWPGWGDVSWQPVLP